MILGIDHIVIVVHDLDKAIADYSSLGFTVVPGGEHADGITHNALVSFADGAYLELIAFRQQAPEHFFYRPHGQEGLVTYALLPANIEEDIAAAREHGLEIEGPLPGGRVRPDGEHLRWQLGRPAALELPFLCGDLTPRELRVPGGEATRHANGVTGISSITVAVDYINRSTEHYRALLGIEPAFQQSQDEPSARVAAFHLGDATIALIDPGTRPGPMRDYLEERGPRPYTLALRVADNAPTGDLDISRTHGARITLIRPARNG